MTNYATGHYAEDAAADYVKKQGYRMLEKNWRTRYCEIDIIAEKDRAVYFIEVKYRQAASQGSGLDYITSQKLKQMRFAAEMWVQEHRWTGEYRLGAIEVSGSDFEVTNFISDWM